MLLRPDKAGNHLIDESGREVKSVEIEVMEFQEFVEKFTHSTNFQKECYSDYLGKEANAEKQRVKNAILAEKAGKAKVSKASWKKELY